MEYKGKLYARCGNVYVELNNTAEEIDELVAVSEHILHNAMIIKQVATNPTSLLSINITKLEQVLAKFNK